MDIKQVFKNNVTMDNVQNISQKTVLQKNSAFSELYCWTYLSIHDVQVLILTEYFRIFCKFGEIKYNNTAPVTNIFTVSITLAANRRVIATKQLSVPWKQCLTSCYF